VFKKNDWVLRGFWDSKENNEVMRELKEENEGTDEAVR